ncbi:MAG TPA: NAD(P)-dependent alcohol dehydrogenase [Pedococcus sp.]|jgi:NADPH:quinone reductase-like Zn-dependent oxidoreductase
MRAIVQQRYGGPEAWELREVADPVPGRGQVVVRVEAAGVDRGTWHVMRGLPMIARPALGWRGPRVPTPGRDLAGVVAAVGPEVTGLAVGDPVFGTGRGSLAELALARADQLALRPASLGPVEAAAVPVSGQTALQALRHPGRVQPGERVLVLGASGGVGTYAVQLASAFGADVTGVCSAAKADLVRSLGASRVLDYRTDSLSTDTLGADGSRFDRVLDIGGNRPLAQLRSLLTPRGTLVIVGGEGGGRWTGGMARPVGAAARSPFVAHNLVMLVARERGEDVARLARLAEAGAYRPVVERVFPLEEAAKAMGHLEAGHARGKLVVRVAAA